MENIMSFDNMLDNVSKLPADEQLMLAEIIKKRIIEQRRKELAVSVKEGMIEYNSGKAKTGTVDDFLRDIENEL
ncbi:MAG: hypothetical protein WCZ90_16485 [Melioribacteraceae bacterium]